MKYIFIFLLFMQDVNSQMSRNILIVEPDEIEVVKLENFKKGERLNIFKVVDVSKKAEIKFRVSSKFSFNQFIFSVSPYMNLSDTICLFSDFEGNRYYLGNFSPSKSVSFLSQKNDIKVDIDILSVKNKVSELDAGIVFLGEGKRGIKLINLVMTDTSHKLIYKTFIPTTAVNIEVPKISQMTQQVEYNQDICSPTSLSMVLKYYGVKVDTVSVAGYVYDNSASIYGNWIFNTSYASFLGFYAFIARINSYDFLYKILKIGVPVIASISFGPGELKNSPIKKTNGHLVVIKGINKKGGIIVNDPAGINDESVELVYDPYEFFKAWIVNKYGTSYIITDGEKIQSIIEIFKQEEK
ncbi:MAG: C39 family peptidase [Elusimicrobiales bacterium]|nr:C39 family peptidase [Elusimicrobiales bacterium]